MMMKRILAMFMAGLMLVTVFGAMPVMSKSAIYQGSDSKVNVNGGWDGYGDPDIYMFEDVYVSVSGRCRTICYTSGWQGYEYKGHIDIFEAIVGDHSKPPEEQEESARLYIEIRNKFGIKVFSCDLIVGPVGVEDATGIFFWDFEPGWGYSEFPPELSIQCYSKGRVQVHVYLAENVRINNRIESIESAGINSLNK